LEKIKKRRGENKKKVRTWESEDEEEGKSEDEE
jgi:hypothetical protein